MARTVPDLVDATARAQGVLLGLAVGDALGATVEFMTPSEIRATLGEHREIVGRGWLRLRPGAVTDDTEMSLCVARSIAASGAFDLAHAAAALAQWLRSGPIDVGNTCRRGLRRFIVEGTLEGPRSEGDAGNGAAMRVAPVALAALGDDALLVRQAIAQGRLTHHHPLSDAACVLVGRLVQRACQGRPLAELRQVSEEAAAAHAQLRWEPYRGPCSAYVADTLRTVLHHLFRTSSFEGCLVAVVNEGGDADTAGAIAGAIAGGHYGPEALPARWLARLDRRLVAELRALAATLVALSPLGRGASRPIS